LYFGIYLQGKNSPDQFWDPAHPNVAPSYLNVVAGDQVKLRLERGSFDPEAAEEVDFTAEVDRPSRHGAGDGDGELVLPAPQIQGTSAECLVAAPRNPGQFARFSPVRFDVCGGSATASSSPQFRGDTVPINTAPGSRSFTVTTTSGKGLTRNRQLAQPGGTVARPFSISRL
jgi:hypothetical protein